jgi:ribosome maturation factor RimP
MIDKLEQIKLLLQPIFEQRRILLVDIELRGHSNNQVLSIFADTEEGITMQQITDITREIEDTLEMEDPIKGKYRLDVSSPGIDRPLREIWQYRKNLGRKLKVNFKQMEKIKDVTGILHEVGEDNIILKINNEELNIPISHINKAVVMVKW